MVFAKCNCESRSNISCYKSVDKEKQIQKDEGNKIKMLKVSGRHVTKGWNGGGRLRGRRKRGRRKRKESKNQHIKENQRK